MSLSQLKTRWLSSLWFLLLGAVVGLPILGIVIWWVSWELSHIPNQNWQEVASIAQAIASVLTLGPILWAVLRYRRLAEDQKKAAEDQKKAKHYQAWQAISDAQGKPGSGGRRTALEDLNSDGVSLVGVDLSGRAYLAHLKLPGANLVLVNLQGANLLGANLQKATLVGANLQKAYLEKVDLQKANLLGANLQKAYMEKANLQKATLREANLQEALLMMTNLQETTLRDANLQGANLSGANLQKANLAGASLQEATLRDANLQEAKLTMTNLQETDLLRANLSTSRNLTREQILSTRDWRGAVLPANLKDLELPKDSMKEELNRLRRTWKSAEEPE